MVVFLLLLICYVDTNKISILCPRVSRQPSRRYGILIKVLPLRYAFPIFVAGMHLALCACHDQRKIPSSSACSRLPGKLHHSAPLFSSGHHTTDLALFLASPHIQRDSFESLRIVRPSFLEGRRFVG